MANERSYLEDATEDDILRLTQAMRTLTNYPEWKDYLELLKANRIAAREQVVDGDVDPAQLSTFRGLVRGLTLAGEAPASLIEKGELILKRRQAEIDQKKVVTIGRGEHILRPLDGDDSAPTFAG